MKDEIVAFKEALTLQKSEPTSRPEQPEKIYETVFDNAMFAAYKTGAVDGTPFEILLDDIKQAMGLYRHSQR